MGGGKLDVNVVLIAFEDGRAKIIAGGANAPPPQMHPSCACT